jgi:uncharacterized membrane protein YoaT (DUF817 family)
MQLPSHAPYLPATFATKFRALCFELGFFLLKQARACVFTGLFFIAVLMVPRAGWLGVPRYDLLLLVAVLIQAAMLYKGLETWDEFKTICLFHLFGLALELFKTSSGIRSWSYPEFAYSKVFGVPLFSGFMYAAVGSYIIQIWRELQLRILHHPPYWMATTLALAMYANFFTHHFVGDYRWYLAACALGLYARSTVVLKAHLHDRRMPLLLGLVGVGWLIWLAENVGTFFGLWAYPHQLGAWAAVHVSKWSAWTLLVLLMFTLVANLKHIKAKIHIAR